MFFFLTSNPFNVFPHPKSIQFFSPPQIRSMFFLTSNLFNVFPTSNPFNVFFSPQIRSIFFSHLQSVQSFFFSMCFHLLAAPAIAVTGLLIPRQHCRLNNCCYLTNLRFFFDKSEIFLTNLRQAGFFLLIPSFLLLPPLIAKVDIFVLSIAFITKPSRHLIEFLHLLLKKLLACSLFKFKFHSTQCDKNMLGKATCLHNLGGFLFCSKKKFLQKYTLPYLSSQFGRIFLKKKFLQKCTFSSSISRAFSHPPTASSSSPSL